MTALKTVSGDLVLGVCALLSIRSISLTLWVFTRAFIYSGLKFIVNSTMKLVYTRIYYSGILLSMLEKMDVERWNTRIMSLFTLTCKV